MKKRTAVLIAVIAVCLGVYIGGVLCTYFYALPMIMKGVAKERYNYEWYANWQDNEKLDRFFFSLVWFSFAFEKEIPVNWETGEIDESRSPAF